MRLCAWCSAQSRGKKEKNYMKMRKETKKLQENVREMQENARKETACIGSESVCSFFTLYRSSTFWPAFFSQLLVRLH